MRLLIRRKLKLIFIISETFKWNQKRGTERVLTRTKVVRASVDEIHKTSTAIKLSKEDGGISLRLRGFDPLKARSYATIVAASFT